MHKLLITALIAIGLTGTAEATIPVLPKYSATEIKSAFRSYKDIPALGATVPTVVRIPLGGELLERREFALENIVSGALESYLLEENLPSTNELFVVRASGAISDAAFMGDNNDRTYTEFPLTETGSSAAEIRLSSRAPITSSLFALSLDRFVARPTNIEIRAIVGGTERIILANTNLETLVVRFPETTSTEWRIRLSYSQPLRITELRLENSATRTPGSRSLLYLAQPGATYRLYLDPDRFVNTETSPAAHLATASNIVTISPGTSRSNPAYVIADTDGDEIPDVRDNCIGTANKDQADVNGNGRGDVCDDFDVDGILNTNDNCPNLPNTNQRDEDGDSIGDVCDNEESRLTEKYPWLPWLGIGFAALVLVGLMIITIRSSPPPPPPEITPSI